MRRIVKTESKIPSTILCRNNSGYQIDAVDGELVHRILYTQAHGPIDKSHEIHHIDCNKLNNDIENLISIPRKFHVYIHRKYGYRDLPNRAGLAVELEHWSKLIDEFNKLTVRLRAIESALHGNLGRKRRRKEKPARQHHFPCAKHTKHHYY